LKWRGVAIPLWQGHVAILACFGGSLDSASCQYRFGIAVFLLCAVASAWVRGEGHAAGLSRMETYGPDLTAGRLV